jgi:hypothetical protein
MENNYQKPSRRIFTAELVVVETMKNDQRFDGQPKGDAEPKFAVAYEAVEEKQMRGKKFRYRVVEIIDSHVELKPGKHLVEMLVDFKSAKKRDESGQWKSTGQMKQTFTILGVAK